MGAFGRLLPILLLSITLVVAPPPKRQEAEAQQKQEEHHQQQQQENNDSKPFYQFAYSKYLENVVKILESHPKFAERLKTMSQDDIKAGKVADHMDVLETEVFDELTKHKLAEIERLREEIQKQMEQDGGAHNIKVPEHLDVNDLQRFGQEDLRKLIVKTVADMEEMDKARREEFKEYEMKKKAEEEHRLAQMTPEEREKELKEIEESKKRHNEHEKLKHPGSRDQLEEVWEDKDGMDKDSFDPKAFFALHDLNGDGFWNEEEIEALFQIELDKIYNETNPDDDPKERIEEMYRMREHVVGQMDTNKDRLISLTEFLNDNEAQDPNQKEPEWQDLAQQQVYTDEELKKFEEEYAKQQGRAHELNEGAGHQVPVNQQQQYQQQGQVHQQQPPQQPGQQQYQQNQQVPQQQHVNQQVPPQGQQQQYQQQPGQQQYQQQPGQQQYQQQPIQGQQQVYQQQPPQGQAQPVYNQGQQVPVQGQQQQVPVQGQQQQVPVQGQPQQVYQQVPQQQAVPVQTQQQQQQQVPQQGGPPPKVPKAVDPVYGI